MIKFTVEEEKFINSLHEPVRDINMNLINSIINKMISNKDYEELIYFLDTLNDFAIIPNDFVDKLILSNNKECISFFLDHENILYFLIDEEKEKLKKFLNVSETNIRLKESYDYYYKLIFKQKVRPWKTKKINNNIIEHTYIKGNKLIKLKLKEVIDIGVVASCIFYSNYNLSKEEQILKGIDYLNEFGFNIDRDINNDSIIKNM